MADKFPGYQNMISVDDCDTIRRRHAHNLEVYGATEEDCRIVNLQETPPYSLERKQGFQATWQLHWTTYKGWKVYMLHTGMYASIPEYEMEPQLSSGGGTDQFE